MFIMNNTVLTCLFLKLQNYVIPFWNSNISIKIQHSLIWPEVSTALLVSVFIVIHDTSHASSQTHGEKSSMGN